ncbi:MAG: 4Fe-4S dicluster domain-containing protein [Candidatus Eisenbacteria bacterium]|nr:4Fe-4S dicluster domain-containing protein [Candidatus Eisenbacteria bacterium]
MKIKQGSSWRDVPIAGNILEPGTSAELKTGAWRADVKPKWHADRCIQCSQCWVFCPDVAIRLDDEGKVCGIDYDYCKGCGLCASVCPEKANAIEMVPEAEEV